ncbi:MAG: D-alanine--D-alanine ligase [Pelotomaculum thermopropionicum]|uniref:D-alanine--D-alanine ligase n=1 Tax=Pelotomaculum thermopropionicum TaxID=110500 RepID=A0A124FYQ2_9FIRM|nr:MAG: D-alanine--D-alanine ligase [Pelotomaculum thermopropionicum]
MAPKIGVLLGGRSAEREVSLRTGEAVYQALKIKGYPAVKIDVDMDIVEKIKESGIELAFLALHGKYGEDGTIQGMLEMLDIAYTGSSVLASALAIDKIATKKMLLFTGLPTPKYMQVERKEAEIKGLETVAAQIYDEIDLPLVVKAPTQGSTIGMSFIHKKEDLVPAMELAYQHDPVALVEQFIEGIEVTASVLGNEQPVALPLIEIISATGIYDYEAKYTAGMSEHIIPPRISEELQNTVKNLAVRTFKALGCRDLARVDFIIDHLGNPYILEVNTIPGMTATSLFPDAARAAGIEFPDLVDQIVKLALVKS